MKIQFKHRDKTLWRVLSVAILIVGLVFAFIANTKLAQPAHAATGINQQLNYQGRLMDISGAIVADGTYNMEFKIYQDGTGCVTSGTPPCSGTLKWTETRTGSNKVTVTNGFFSVQLGSVTAFGTSVDWNQDTLWLSINIGGTGTPSWDGEMTPFRRLTAVPYAFNSKQLGGIDWDRFVQIAPSAVQTDSSLTSMVFLNKTGASGNILQLQDNGSDVLTIDNSGISTFSSQIRGASGTSGAPSFSFGSDTDTGIYLAGTNTIGIATSGSPIITIDANSMDSLGYYSQTNGTDSTQSFQINDADGGDPVFIIDTVNERVGIGTPSPTEALHVDGNMIITGHSALGATSAIDDCDGIPGAVSCSTILTAKETYTGTSSTVPAGMISGLTVDPGSSPSYAFAFGGGFATSVASGNSTNIASQLIGSFNSVEHNGTGTASIATGSVGYVGNNSTGTITEATAFLAQVIASSGTIDNAIGLRVFGVSGSITNSYGVYIDNMGGTNDYGIFQAHASDSNYFAGIVDLGTLGSADTVAYLCRNSAGEIADCNTTGAGVAWVQDGNSFGATGVLGTNDSNGLAFETNGVTQMTLAVGGAANFQNSTDSTTGFQIKDADGGTPIFNVDTTNERVGIGTASPSNTLTVSGNANFTGKIALGTNAQIDQSIITDYSGDTFNTLLNIQYEFTDLSADYNGGITNHTILNPTVDASSVSYTNFNEVQISPGNAFDFGTIAGNSGVVDHAGTGNVSFLAGNVTQIRNSSTGTADNAYGNYITLLNESTGTITTAAGEAVLVSNNAAGTISNAYGLNVQLQNLNASGTISNAFGLRVDSNNSGTINNYYGLWLGADSGIATTSYGIYNQNRELTQVTSTTASQVNDASGNSIAKVNTTDAEVTFNESKMGQVDSWSTASNALPAVRQNHAATSYNGYLYAIGGSDGSTLQTTVYYAKVLADGSPDTWNTTTALSTATQQHRAVAVNGYMYVLGGNTGSTVSTVSYAKINSDGTLGSWSATTSLPAVRQSFVADVYNGYIYVVGGYNGSADQTTIYYARPNASGTISAWTTASNPLPTATSRQAGGILNGYLYNAGGFGVTDMSRSQLADNGAPGTWTTQTSYFFLLSTDMDGFVGNGKLYTAGGNFFGCSAAVNYHTPSTTGAMTATGTDALPAARCNPKTTVENGYAYAIGGENSGAQSTVYYSSLPRTAINGSLDLVSLSGLNTTDTGGLSTLYAGDISAVGNISAQGDGWFGGGLVVNNASVLRGETRLENYFTQQNGTDSTTAFQIFDADGGTPVFNVDTTNERVGIGTASPSSTLHVDGTTTITGDVAIGSSTTANQCNFVDGLTTCNTLISAHDIFTDTGSNPVVGFAQGVTLNPASNPSTTGYVTGAAGGFSINTASGNAINFSGQSYLGTYGVATHNGTGTVSAMSGNAGGVENRSSGTIGLAQGFVASISNYSTGSISDARGLSVSSVNNTGGGTITNAYGVYIHDQTAATNDYGIVIEGADTYALWLSSAANNTDAANGITFGLSGDTNLYRNAANVLRTDDSMRIVGHSGTGASGGINDITLLHPGEDGYVINNNAETITDVNSYDRIAAVTGYLLVNPSGAVSGTHALYGAENYVVIDPSSTQALTSSFAIGTRSVVDNYGSGNIGTIRGSDNAAGHYGSGTASTLEGINVFAAGTGTITTAKAINASFINAGTATTTTAMGLYYQLNNSSTGTVTTNYGIQIDSSQNASGTLTNNYGILVQDQTAGTNDYGIVVAGADTYALWVGSGANNTDAANGITFGSSGDTNLYRGAANQLKSDDDLVLAGGDLTLGVGSSVNGTMTLQNATNAFGVTISATGQTTGSATISIPNTSGANDNFCLQTLGNCAGGGATLQTAYVNGNTITATDAEGDIDLTVSEATNFSVDITGTGSFLVQDSGSAILTVADGGQVTVAQDLAVNGGDITSSATTFNLLNSTVTTANLLDAATAINLGAAAGTTITPGGNLTFAESNTKNITIQSSLAGGARSANLLTLTQANDATNNSTGNMLRIDQLDTATTSAAVYIDNNSTAAGGYAMIVDNANTTATGTGIRVLGAAAAANARGIEIAGITTGTGILATPITTGTGFRAGTALTSGTGVAVDTTNTGMTSARGVNVGGTASGTLSSFTGSYMEIDPIRTHTGATTITDTGNWLNVERVNTINNAGGTFNVSGALVDLSSSCTVTAGTCTDTANILNIAQSYASASGTVFALTGAGTGNLATLDASNASANGVLIDVQSSSTSQYGLSITSNNGGTNVLYARADGRVGIGNAAPGAKLEVSGVTGTEVGAIINNGSSTGNIINFQDGGTNVLTIADGGAATFQNTTNSTTGFRVLASGGTNIFNVDTTNNRVGIGTASPGVRLDVTDSQSASNVAAITNSANAAGANGLDITAGENTYTTGSNLITFKRPDGTTIGSVAQNTSTTVAYNTTSDARLKENITETDMGLGTVLQLKIYDYNYKDDANQTKLTGFLAQELYNLFPGAVTVGSDEVDANGNLVNPWAVDYGKLTPLLAKGIQDLNTKVDALEAKVNSKGVSQGVFNGGIVTDDIEFQGLATFDALTTFKGQTVFLGGATFNAPTTFKDRIVVSSNTAGRVKIPAGLTKIEVVFSKPYAKAPVVNVTPVGIIQPKYGVVNATPSGFEIQIDPAQAADIEFNWFAVEAQ